MKKKLLGIMAVAAVAIVAGYNVYISQAGNTLSELALSNVEALARDFEWDGDNWTSDDQWYNDIPGTSSWTPTLVDCTVTTGIDICGIIIQETVSGKKVVCTTGSGNCSNGSPCSAG